MGTVLVCVSVGGDGEVKTKLYLTYSLFPIPHSLFPDK
ncbi:hypothetical protein MC7420_8311 [Coleofasciculus chthonoplastes PCC 7420]|uniref:Uncharacterized protein n=1 Tax=Coleofasciculus chthonoplastes PCC 7420 TaxID=118168 RepID=B4W0R6_9CYAN|nr:hypothetical protein MC7420_8311 [Coleofasciculus chthonoplastes PCC 7420]